MTAVQSSRGISNLTNARSHVEFIPHEAGGTNHLKGICSLMTLRLFHFSVTDSAVAAAAPMISVASFL